MTFKPFKAPTRETFEDLLYAVHNIGAGSDPDTAFGRNLTKSAMKTFAALYDLMDHKQHGTIQGVLVAVRLLAETTCAKDPQAYAELEIVRGNENDRTEEVGAAIKLPRDLLPSDFALLPETNKS